MTAASKFVTKLGRRLLQLQASRQPRRSRTRPTTGASITWPGPSTAPPSVVWAAPASMPRTLVLSPIMLRLPSLRIECLRLLTNRMQLPLSPTWHVWRWMNDCSDQHGSHFCNYFVPWLRQFTLTTSTSTFTLSSYISCQS